MIRVACPVSGCGNSRDRTHEMCASCWAEVPERLRAEIRRHRSTWEFDDRYWDARAAALEVAEDALAQVAA